MKTQRGWKPGMWEAGMTMAETLHICKHSGSMGHCKISDDWCCSAPCTLEQDIEYAPVWHGQWISLTECANEGVYCVFPPHGVDESKFLPLNRCVTAGPRFEKWKMPGTGLRLPGHFCTQNQFFAEGFADDRCRRRINSWTGLPNSFVSRPSAKPRRL